MNIICYTGGTCGDIITGIIDARDIDFNGSSMETAPNRSRLKKPHTFADDFEKNAYVDSMKSLYNSLPSHDLEYHVRQGHDFISITVEDFNVALWAAERFKSLHKPYVWEEMQKFCGANTVEDYAQVLIDFSSMVKTHTDKILKLERIISGHAVEDLLQWVPDINDDILYQQWLVKNNKQGEVK
jgi:hypothetical protein